MSDITYFALGIVFAYCWVYLCRRFGERSFRHQTSRARGPVT